MKTGCTGCTAKGAKGAKFNWEMGMPAQDVRCDGAGWAGSMDAGGGEVMKPMVELTRMPGLLTVNRIRIVTCLGCGGWRYGEEASFTSKEFGERIRAEGWRQIRINGVLWWHCPGCVKKGRMNG